MRNRYDREIKMIYGQLLGKVRRYKRRVTFMN